MRLREQSSQADLHGRFHAGDGGYRGFKSHPRAPKGGVPNDHSDADSSHQQAPDRVVCISGDYYSDS